MWTVKEDLEGILAYISISCLLLFPLDRRAAFATKWRLDIVEINVSSWL
jgi:uncharacterized membrane protein YsdA (DUF1294 family)